MTEESKPVEEQVENQAHVEEEAKAEPLALQAEELPPISRKHVTAIVKRERQDAYQKAKREFMAELEAQQAAQVQPQVVAQAPGVGLGGMAHTTPEQLHQMVADAAKKLDDARRAEEQQKHQYQTAQNIAQSFNSQMAQSKLSDPDFDNKMKDLDFQSMSEIVHLATETGMAGEIMKDLSENPQKITHLMILAHSQPNLAKREMSKLAASIKSNQEAAQQASPRDPLSPITPSTVGTDSGNMSVNDYRKMFL